MPLLSSSSSSDDHVIVPYFILDQDDGHKVKALFTVPSHLAKSLVEYPIMCRGACFDLHIDSVNGGSEYNTESVFLMTEFESPHPEETASAISLRLASRVKDSASRSNLLGSVLGM